jgi:hypothetical protein
MEQASDIDIQLLFPVGKAITLYLVVEGPRCPITTKVSHFVTDAKRPIDALSRCYDEMIYNNAKACEIVPRLLYTRYIYEGILDDYRKVERKNRPLNWLNELPRGFEYSIFLVNEGKTIKESIASLRYLQTILKGTINYESIIQCMLTYCESSGEHSHLLATVERIFDLFYQNNSSYRTAKEIREAKKDKKDLHLCLYNKRQGDYKRTIPLGGNPQKVTIFIPNYHGEGEDYRTTFNVYMFNGVHPLDLYWICYYNLLSKGINTIRSSCSIDGTDVFEMESSIQCIHHCEVVEVMYTPKEPYYVANQLDNLLVWCTKSQNHFSQISLVDGYIKQLVVEHSITGQPKYPAETLITY